MVVRSDTRQSGSRTVGRFIPQQTSATIFEVFGAQKLGKRYQALLKKVGKGACTPPTSRSLSRVQFRGSFAVLRHASPFHTSRFDEKLVAWAWQANR